jgi:hypothetical protein
MSGREESVAASPEAASFSLNEGLRTCRLVVQSYRQLLIGDPAEPADLTADNDDPMDARPES